MTDAAATAAPGGPAATDSSRSWWMLSPSFTAGTVVAVVFAAAGLVFARVDLALVALPLVVTAAWGWDRRLPQRAASTAEVRLAEQPSAGAIPYVVSIRQAPGVESVSVRLSTLRGAPRHIVVAASTARELRGRAPVLHTGYQEIVRVDYRLVGTDGAFTTAPIGPVVAFSVIPSPAVPVVSLPLPRRLTGLNGAHDSARPGDGGEFRDIHRFAAGDRLRRIDWKATARRAQHAGDLYVRRTAATADAAILIVLDSRDDVGEQVAEWSSDSAALEGLSSLDLAREAAGSLAAGYIRSGDRIGFIDLAGRTRMVAPGGGARHLERVRGAVDHTRPSGMPRYAQRPPVVTPGALIYVLSTFLDDDAARLAALWRAGGHRVIAVDVMPTVRFDRASRRERMAHRIVEMERVDRIRSIQAQGVELLRWQETAGSASRAAALRALSAPVRRGR